MEEDDLLTDLPRASQTSDSDIAGGRAVDSDVWCEGSAGSVRTRNQLGGNSPIESGGSASSADKSDSEDSKFAGGDDVSLDGVSIPPLPPSPILVVTGGSDDSVLDDAFRAESPPPPEFGMPPGLAAGTSVEDLATDDDEDIASAVSVVTIASGLTQHRDDDDLGGDNVMGDGDFVAEFDDPEVAIANGMLDDDDDAPAAAVDDAADDADERGSSIFEASVSSGYNSVAEDVAHGGAVAVAQGAGGSAAVDNEAHSNRFAAACRILLGSSPLGIALEVWGLTSLVSTRNMVRLYRILWSEAPEAARSAKLPKDYKTTIKVVSKAEKTLRGQNAGFVPITVPVTEPGLLRMRITHINVVRRSIKETVTKICQNPANKTGSIRVRGVSTPEQFGDIMDSPMLLRIQDLVQHQWAAAGVPEEQRLTLYTVISEDGTAIDRASAMPVEASTLCIANLDRDHRNAHGNIKLLSAYRCPTLHNPTVASQMKSKYKPSDDDYHAMRCVSVVGNGCCVATSPCERSAALPHFATSGFICASTTV
jgi:hypothetical protein